MTGFYRVLQGFTGFYRVLLGFTELYLVWPGFTEFLLGFTGLGERKKSIEFDWPVCPFSFLFIAFVYRFLFLFLFFPAALSFSTRFSSISSFLLPFLGRRLRHPAGTPVLFLLLFASPFIRLLRLSLPFRPHRPPRHRPSASFASSSPHLHSFISFQSLGKICIIFFPLHLPSLLIQPIDFHWMFLFFLPSFTEFFFFAILFQLKTKKNAMAATQFPPAPPHPAGMRMTTFGVAYWNDRRRKTKKNETKERRASRSIGRHKTKKNTHPSSSHTLANIVLEINRVSNDFYWVFTEFYCGLLSFHGYHPVLRGFYLSFTEFGRVLPSLTGFYLVLLGFTGFHLVLQGFLLHTLSFTEFYWVLLSYTGFDWVLPSFT